ncbi:MAG: hypothetical protein U1E36_02270 [Rickettsiales bacterium]
MRGADEIAVALPLALHTPVDLDLEDKLDSELKGWLASSLCLPEIKLLTNAVNGNKNERV